MTKSRSNNNWDVKFLRMLENAKEKFSTDNCLWTVSNNKGGVGKTTFAQSLIDYAIYRGHQVNIAQIDRQERLSHLYDRTVLTIKSDPDAARENPDQELARFAPIMDWAERRGQGPLVLDLGANEVDRFSTWARLCMFEEELIEQNTPVINFIVFTAEEQSILEAAQTASAMRRAFPSSQIVYVENQRFGKIADLHGNSAKSFKTSIEPALSSSPFIQVPRIPSISYQHFEQARLRFSDVASLSAEQVMSLTGLSKADAKIARGDVAAWLVTVFDRLDVLFDWTVGDDGDVS